MFELANLILSIVNLIVFIIYAYCTYLIAKDTYEPFISFTFNQIEQTHIGFSMQNRSKVEVEVFGKLWSNVRGHRFEFKDSFYGDGHSWILQPFTEGKGHFYLTDLICQEGIRLEDLINEWQIKSIKINFQIRYRKVGSLNWKKSSPQNFAYSFKENVFWLNV